MNFRTAMLAQVLSISLSVYAFAGGVIALDGGVVPGAAFSQIVPAIQQRRYQRRDIAVTERAWQGARLFHLSRKRRNGNSLRRR